MSQSSRMSPTAPAITHILDYRVSVCQSNAAGQLSIAATRITILSRIISEGWVVQWQFLEQLIAVIAGEFAEIIFVIGRLADNRPGLPVPQLAGRVIASFGAGTVVTDLRWD